MSTLYVNNIEPVSGSSLILISASLVSVDSITTPSFTSSFQGDLQGTASFAITASHALNSTPPAGTIGQVQFSSGSIFGADSNLFWDNTNKRLGVGTNAPTRALEVRGSALIQNVSSTDGSIQIGANMGGIVLSSQNRAEIQLSTNARMTTRGAGITFRANSGEPNGAVLGVVGSGATSATTALLVQNSAGTNLLNVRDDNRIIAEGAFETGTANGFIFNSNIISVKINGFLTLDRTSNRIFTIGDTSFTRPYLEIQTNASSNFADVSINVNHFIVKKEGQIIIGGSTVNASAKLQVDSTTQGFLPPRMTTTEKNAISSPAAGLEVYDATVSGSYFHDGNSWRNVIAGDDTNLVWDNVNKRLAVGFNNPSASLHIRGSSTTSATTALLVQNSAGTELLRVRDDGGMLIGSQNAIVTIIPGFNNTFQQNRLSFYSAPTNIRGIFTGGQGIIVSKNTGVTDLYPTAIFAIDSTNQGFLPPRMTTTEKNAISSPASGLQVYDTTLNQMSYYNGTSWVNF